MVKTIPCVLEYESERETVTIRHAQTKCIQMVIKLELGTGGTMARVVPQEDCDNWWIGVKPSDETVTRDLLFSRKRCNIRQIDFSLDGEP